MKGERVGYLRRVAHDLGHADRWLLVLLSVLVVTPFGRLFVSHEYLLDAAGAALVALVASVLLSTRRPFALTLLLAVAGLAAYEVFVVFHIGTPVPDDLGDVWSKATASVQSLRGTALPAVDSPELHTVPVLLAWAACVGGYNLAARTRVVALVLVPALGAYVGALLFTGSRPVGGPWVPLAIVAAGLAVVLVRANALGPEAEVTAATSAAIGDTALRAPTWLKVGIPALVVASVVAVAAGQVLPVVKDDERADVRESYQAPIDLSDSTTPLGLVAAAHQNDANPRMFTVTLSYPSPDPHPPVDLVRIASLEAYDGAVWSTRTRFTRVGEVIPPAPTNAPTVFPVDQRYVLDEAYRSPFVPAMDRPVAIDQSLLDKRTDEALVFDRQAGMVVVSPAPDTGMRYGVASLVADVDEATAAAAPTGSDAAFADLAAMPPNIAPPEALQTYVNDPRFFRGTAFDSLKAIEEDLRSPAFSYSSQSIYDGSVAATGRFLGPVGSDENRARKGDSQQYAATLAVIARMKGLPSRVVVGYRITGDAATVGGTAEVRAKDIHAWTEVHFGGAGWVAFDATNPANTTDPRPPPPTTTTPPTSRVPQQAAVGAAGAATGQQTCDVIAVDCAETVTYVVWWPLLLLLLVLLIPLGIVVAKWMRRRRRRRGTPTHRAIGAWRETMDRLRAHGIPTSNAMTAAELASTSSATAGGETARRLAEFTPVLDSVLYQEAAPDDALADRAWDAEAGVADAIKRQYGPMARFRARLDPRPLLRRR